MTACILPLFAVVLFAGCSTLPADYPRTPSMAFQDYRATSVGKRIAQEEKRFPWESGFAILRRARPAFTSRIVFTELAEKSLDVQYYIREADDTGRILAERLVRAADRGVRVRVLLDDMNLSGPDAPIAAMDAHANIEIRIFNPLYRRDSRILGLLTDLNRLNHRMHNKVMVMDNAVAGCGRLAGRIERQIELVGSVFRLGIPKKTV